MKSPFDIGNDALLIKLPEHKDCDHGVIFDEAEAFKILEGAPYDQSLDPALAFIMGPPGASAVRKRFPRLEGICPKGCGFKGIAYASYAHYIYGDW